MLTQEDVTLLCTAMLNVRSKQKIIKNKIFHILVVQVKTLSVLIEVPSTLWR
jgi:hypothetical protein